MATPSRFSTGFERDYYEQTMTVDGTTIDLSRGDTRVWVNGVALGATYTLPAPLFLGQEVLLIVNGAYPGGVSADVVSDTSINAANETTISFVAKVGPPADSTLLIGVSGRWQVVTNDGPILS